MGRVIIIGGGIIGLFTACELIRHGREVLLLEAAPSAGGLGRNTEIGGFELDIGVRIMPNSIHRLSRNFITATGNIHNFVPLAHRSHLSAHADLELASEAPGLTELGQGVIRVKRVRAAWHDAEQKLVQPGGRERLLDLMFKGDPRRPWQGIRNIRDAAQPLVEATKATPAEQLPDPAHWPSPTANPEDTPGTGLYPRQGPFAGFVDALARRVVSNHGSEIRVGRGVEELDFANGRLQRVRSRGDWLTADEFIFSAAYPKVFSALRVTAPSAPLKSLLQVNLLVKAPIPQWLWEVNRAGPPISRIFYPQRFQGLAPGDVNVISCETLDDATTAREAAMNPAVRIAAVVQQLVTMGRLPSADCVIESRTIAVPSVLPVYPINYFGELDAAVRAVKARASNLHFTGVPAILGPVTPANAALDAASVLASRIAGQA